MRTHVKAVTQSFPSSVIFFVSALFTHRSLFRSSPECFPRAQFATVSTSALTVSGICLFATYGLNSLVERNLKGDYLLVNICLAALSCLTTGILTIIAYNSRHALVV